MASLTFARGVEPGALGAGRVTRRRRRRCPGVVGGGLLREFQVRMRLRGPARRADRRVPASAAAPPRHTGYGRRCQRRRHRLVYHRCRRGCVGQRGAACWGCECMGGGGDTVLTSINSNDYRHGQAVARAARMLDSSTRLCAH